MSGMIPEQNDRHEHVYSLIADGMKKRVVKYDENKKPVYDIVLDERKAWLKTGVVPSHYYGNYTKEVTDYKNLAELAYKYMPQERADQLAQDILLDCASFDDSIDAMSSMTMRDKNHSQACLIDKTLRQKSERDIRIMEEGKRSMMDAITGKEKHDSTRE